MILVLVSGLIPITNELYCHRVESPIQVKVLMMILQVFFARFLSDSCNPECMYYDDDLTVIQDADLKKVTIQLKDQMDELMEIVNKAEKEKKYSVFIAFVCSRMQFNH